MGRRRGWMALAALALVGGCAPPVPPQGVAVPVRGRLVASPAPVVTCSTTFLVVATVSQCGDAGLKFGVAAE